MPVMSKEKKKSADKTKDMHKGRMIRLPKDLSPLLEELAKEADRPLTRELRQALLMYLRAKGKLPPDT